MKIKIANIYFTSIYSTGMKKISSQEVKFTCFAFDLYLYVTKTWIKWNKIIFLTLIFDPQTYCETVLKTVTQKHK